MCFFFYPSCPPSTLPYLSLPSRVLNGDDSATLKTVLSGTTITGFIHLAGRRSLNDCSCQPSLMWASIQAIDLAGKYTEF